MRRAGGLALLATLGGRAAASTDGQHGNVAVDISKGSYRTSPEAST
jgi:hypothetical protein